jgi:hypothetical protein
MSLKESEVFFFGRFLFCFYYYYYCCTNGRKQARSFLLTIGSLENEVGVGTCLSLFSFDSTLLLLLWRLPDRTRMSRVLGETDTERTCICRIE